MSRPNMQIEALQQELKKEKTKVSTRDTLIRELRRQVSNLSRQIENNGAMKQAFNMLPQCPICKSEPPFHDTNCPVNC